jgi:hypothetical protein
MTADRLYQLLPSIYRLRDASSGGALEALLAVVQGEADRLADDLDDLYDDWFIETCRDWVVPYLGELLSARGHYAFGEGAMSLRGFVANTLNFRRRKGTASMLEDLALAVTGWPCRAVEMFTRVATTQHVNHPRPAAHATVRLRHAAALEEIDRAFDPSRRLVDVHNVDGRPRPNLGNVSLFLWRLASLEHNDTAAVADTAAGPGRFRFDPLGVDRVLYGPARTLGDLARSVGDADLPSPARRRPLFAELDQARAAIAAGSAPRYRHFEAGQELFSVTAVGEASPIPPEQIQICNLDAWATLPPPISVTRPDSSTFSTRVAVDPRSGRIAFLGAAPAAVRVTYHHGAAAMIGAGPDDRDHATAAGATVAVGNWALPASPALGDAIAAWVAAGQPSRIIEIQDSGRYTGPPAVIVPPGTTLVIRARGGQRPVVTQAGAWPITLGAGATLVLDGLLVSGGSVVAAAQAGGGDPAGLELRHTTLVPGLGQDAAGDPTAPGSVVLRSDATSTGALHVVVDRSIVGRIDLTGGAPGFVSDVHVSDSVVDGAGDPADALRAHQLSIARTTVLGALTVRSLEASDTIFLHPVTVQRTQGGCVRFSFVPPGSKVPRSYRCQPALALAVPGADAAAVTARLQPAFTTTRFGEAAYVQLATSCPAELRAGGSDGSEMGAHFHLHQPQREANLRQGLDEYLRFGLEAGLVFVT